MKFKRNSKGGHGHGGKAGSSRDPRKDAKEKSHYKAFGDAHPVNDVDSNLKVQIVKEDNADESTSRYQRKNSRRERADAELDEKLDQVEEFVSPFQTLLTDLNKDTSLNKSINSLKRKIEALKSQNKKAKNEKKTDREAGVDGEKSEESDVDSETDSEIEIDESGINTYAQEVLCKDNTESDEKIALDQFTIHFEKNLDEKLIEKLKNNLADRSCLNQMEQSVQLPALGYLKYSPLLEETKVNIAQMKSLEKLNIKQRMLDRINESLKTVLSKEEPTPALDTPIDEHSAYNLDQAQLETLNIISNYSDLYLSSVDVKKDSELKFTYAIHAMNHVLKTRSRVIAHNDKIKQSKTNNSDVEHRDQGLTRPKVLIIVPFRKCALKLVKIFISLIMRKSEEFVSNKKRFFDSFGPEGDENGGAVVVDEEGNEIKKERADDHSFLFSGNVEDHFKIGLSISKKSLKLYTEFYSSDIIIASPLGLKAVIGGIDGEGKMDYDFLSSIEMLIVDNADVLMMQNWEHIVTIFDHLHLQPKKSHDTDFSRVRNWLLEGHAAFYRQTLIFSRIPAPPINSLFNKYCKNYAGKVQTDLMRSDKYQTGSICQVGSQLTQVLFHKIECDEPVGLPDARFNFFVNKILPQFRDEQMAHTLIFIPSYFDFVKMRNYFKKHDLSSMHCSEYIDKKGVDRARYLFYHGRVHFMLLTERFHFYNRYRVRGITNLIFYELPHYPEYFSNFCNYLPDAKRSKNAQTDLDNFTVTALYSDYDAQRLCAVVGRERATHMINSTKSVHMFMIEDN